MIDCVLTIVIYLTLVASKVPFLKDSFVCLVGFCLFVCFGKILYLQISQFIPTSITVKRIGSYRDSVCAIKGNRWHCFLCFSQGHLATVPQIVKSSFYLLSLLLSFKFWVSFCSPSWTQICDSAWSSI